MPVGYCCPYYSWEDGLNVCCEGARLRFADAAERKAYICRYCAAVPGWEDCTIAQNITKRYERSSGDEECRQDKEP